MVPVILHRARWVAPVTAPLIDNGAVAVQAGRILAVGPAPDLMRQWPSGRAVDHGDGVILPGLVNCHVHLEFSALKDRIPPQPRLGDWLAAAMAGFAALPAEEVEAGVHDGLARLTAAGTALVGEVTNTGLSLPVLRSSGMAFHYFWECLGFHLTGRGALEADFPHFADADARSDHFSAAAHAPYSVSPALFRRVAAWNRTHGRRGAVHLAESREELEFLDTGRGFFRDLLTHLGRWQEDFVPPHSSPARYLEELGFWEPNTLAVHGVWLNKADRELLARRQVWLVLCPRSNLHTGAGFPDLPALARAGVPLALGTDSLASNPDLNLFGEMLTMHERYPDIPPEALLTLGTLHGAKALGRAADFGSLEPGKTPGLVFVALRPNADVGPDLLHHGAAGFIQRIAEIHEEF
jgi:cytosine/adenosine deaminase-related metal-dependent hydrolase